MANGPPKLDTIRIYTIDKIQKPFNAPPKYFNDFQNYFNNAEIIEVDKMSKRSEFGNIYKRYVERCFRSSVMDFDDLLLKTNELLNINPEVLSKYQNKFKDAIAAIIPWV